VLSEEIMQVKVFLDVDNDSHRRRIEYVLKNFSLVYGIEFDIVSSIDDVSNNEPLIYYGSNFVRRDKSISIGKSTQAIELFERRKSYDELYEIATIHFVNLKTPLAPVEFEGFNLPVFFVTGEPIFEVDDFLRINFDILSCAFYFLSSWDERVKVKRDDFGRFPDDENLLVKLGVSDLPIVNFYFFILKKFLEKIDVVSKQRDWEGKNFAVCLTHDVDVLRKWSPFGVYNEIVNKFIMGREEIQKRRERFAKFLYYFLKGYDPYREGMGKIFEFENKFGVKSTFFLKSGGATKYDARYKWDEFMFGFVRKLKENGFEIGLHPSFDAFDKIELMRNEKEKILEFVGSNVFGVRQHYLRYNFKITPFIQSELGFKYDSTLGFTSRQGFRCGYAFPFKIFDVDGNVEMEIYEIPIVFMDAVYQYGKNVKSIEEILSEVVKLLRVVKVFGGVMTVLFHNTVYDEFDSWGWDFVYEEFVKLALEEGAFVGSCEEIIDLFETK